jgi:hypothetical protein
MEDEIKRKLRRESKSKLFIAKKTKFLSHKKVDIPKKKNISIFYIALSTRYPLIYLFISYIFSITKQTQNAIFKA